MNCKNPAPPINVLSGSTTPWPTPRGPRGAGRFRVRATAPEPRRAVALARKGTPLLDSALSYTLKNSSIKIQPEIA